MIIITVIKTNLRLILGQTQFKHFMFLIHLILVIISGERYYYYPPHITAQWGVWGLLNFTRSCIWISHHLNRSSSTSIKVNFFFFFFRHRYTCVPHPEPSSFLPPHTIPLGRPSAPAPSIQYRASNLDWRLVSYIILYMFQCHSLKSPHPLPLPQSP